MITVAVVLLIVVAVLMVGGGVLIRRGTGKGSGALTYGHPHPPVPAIRASLPPVNFPLSWETWVEGSALDPVMMVRLVDISGTEVKVLASRRKGLDCKYNEFRTKEFRQKYFNSFVSGVSSWAYEAAAQHQPNLERRDYRLGLA